MTCSRTRTHGLALKFPNLVPLFDLPHSALFMCGDCAFHDGQAHSGCSVNVCCGCDSSKWFSFPGSLLRLTSLIPPLPWSEDAFYPHHLISQSLYLAPQVYSDSSSGLPRLPILHPGKIGQQSGYQHELQVHSVSWSHPALLGKVVLGKFLSLS